MHVGDKKEREREREARKPRESEKDGGQRWAYVRGRGLECCHASNVSHVCRIMLYGASLALCITLGGSPAAQIPASCCCDQLCWSGTSLFFPSLTLTEVVVVLLLFLHSSALYGSYFSSCFVEHTWRFAWPAVIAVMHHTLLPVAVVSFVSQVGPSYHRPNELPTFHKGESLHDT